jgi:hypothetical protein
MDIFDLKPEKICFTFDTIAELTAFCMNFKGHIDSYKGISVADAGNLYFSITGKEGPIDNMFNHMRGWTDQFLDYGFDSIVQDGAGIYLYLSEPVMFEIKSQRWNWNGK